MAIRIKTGMYYLRTKAAVDAIKFTLNNDKKKAEPIEVKEQSIAIPAVAEAVEMSADEYR
jgi:ribonucleoside-diphosphate reductase alpha chain